MHFFAKNDIDAIQIQNKKYYANKERLNKKRFYFISLSITMVLQIMSDSDKNSRSKIKEYHELFLISCLLFVEEVKITYFDDKRNQKFTVLHKFISGFFDDRSETLQEVRETKLWPTEMFYF